MDMDNRLNLEQILGYMEDVLDGAKQMPFSAGRISLDGEQMRELITAARAAIPDEIKKANSILDDRAAIIAGAKKEAESLVRRAEERAKVLVSNDEITKQARQQGIDIINQAQTTSKMLKNSAYEYIEEILAESEKGLSDALNDVRRTRTALKSKGPGSRK